MAEQTPQSDTPIARNQARGWLHNPDLPIDLSPIFVWPPRPVAAFRWLARSWLQASTMLIIFALALVGAALLPSMETMQALSPVWIGQIWLRHVVFLILVAGGLHHWFYGVDGQGKLLKYDPRPYFKRKNALFKFGYQTWDNVYHSMMFGATFLSVLECFLRWSYASGWINTLSFGAHPVWFIALFPVLALWQSLHFYVVHLALHQPAIYKHVHAVHHRNVNTGPWSGMSMHPIEAFGYLSAILIVLLLPSHPVHMLFLGYWLMLGAASSHSGYEAIWARDRQALLLGAFFHQLHHRYYECNYGNAEMPWDKWFGTYHDGSEDAPRRTRDRKRQMHS